jgi:hypothetical protein|uniref:Uncharacterized protein n=1 Tax=Siphoviridae sp. ct6d71 TaxID=2826298 RepID=A0A8S5R2W2_9CAUD|nr:MAG TPA: hypothetical protein [Siphoviridae sp. ct6d71]
MAEVKAPGGNFFLNSEQFYITKNRYGQPVLNSIDSGGGGNIVVAINKHNNDKKAHQNIELDAGEIV